MARIRIGLALCVALMLTQSLTAQSLRYKMIDLGTLGGPNSAEGVTVPVISDQGVVIGGSDTALLDPNCVFPPNCLDLHAFRWREGTITDLGTLPGGNNSLAYSINARGQIVGLAENGTFDFFANSPVTRAALWQNGHVADLGDFGGRNGFANAINNRGQVAGGVQNAVNDPFFGNQVRAFLWEKGVLQDLGTLGGPDASADHVNGRGEVAGTSFVNLTPACGDIATVHAFLWRESTMQDLETLGGSCSYEFGLNDRGQVAGDSALLGDQTAHPFRWEFGKMIDLGTLGGSWGHVFGINGKGDVIGTSALPGDFLHHAFFWRDGMTDLGTIDGDPCSDAHGINIRDQVVGSSTDCGGDEGELHGFVWQPKGPMIDLNAFVPPDSDLTITDGQTINDRGEIAASGMMPNGDFHAVLLIPCGATASPGDRCRDAMETRSRRVFVHSQGAQGRLLKQRLGMWNSRSSSLLPWVR